MRQILLVCLFLITGLSRSLAAEVTLPEDSRFTVIVTGNGPDVILLPGLATPRAVWDGTQAALGGRYRLHLVELKGFGGTAGGPNVPGPNLSGGIIETAVQQLADYARANRLDRPAVIGHSMGGLAALMLVVRAPDVPGRVMLVDALPFFGLMMGPDMTVAAMMPQASIMRNRLVSNYGKPPDAAGARSTGSFNALTPAAQQQVAGWTTTADSRVVGQAVYEVATTDIRPDLPRIAVPVTLVYPWSDARFPKDAASTFYRRAYASLPSLRFVDIGNAGHFVMLDRPTAFAAAVQAFLER